MINKNIFYLGIVSFFTDFASALINPIVPIFAIVYLKANMQELGVIMAFATFFSYGTRIISGYISDKYSLSNLLIWAGYLISAFSKPLIGFSTNWIEVAFLKSFERVGKGIRSPAKDFMIAHFSKSKNIGKAFGFHKSFDIGGELLGGITLFAILFFSKSDSENVMRNIFYLSLLPGIFALIFLTKIEKAQISKKTKKIFLTKTDFSVIKNLFFYFLFLFFFFNEAFFVVAAKNSGIRTPFIALLFILSTLAQTSLSYISGIFIDRVGIKKSLYLAFGLGVGAQAVLLAKVFVWMAFLCMGLFVMLSLTAFRAYIGKVSQNKGSVFGIFYGGIALFAGIGSVVIGWLWDRYGDGFAMKFSLAGTFFCLILFYYFFTERREDEQKRIQKGIIPFAGRAG